MAKDRTYHRSCLKKKFDEYYTTMYEVEFLFREVIDIEQLKGKTIWLPADGETSNFTIYLKEQKDIIQYKDLIYTWDDMFEHEDLFESADYIITNPPFSRIMEMLELLKRHDKKFFLFGSLGMITGYAKIYDNNEVFYMRRTLPDRNKDYFETPIKMEKTGDYKTYVNLTIYMTNMELRDNEYVRSKRKPRSIMNKSFDEIPHVWYETEDGKKLLNIDFIRNYPNDYDGYAMVPISVYLSAYKDYFEYYGEQRSKGHCSDGKSRYWRIIVKRKI